MLSLFERIKYMFLIPKEISSENKLWKSIYIKDFIIILETLFFAWITSSSIYEELIFFYYVFFSILSFSRNIFN